MIKEKVHNIFEVVFGVSKKTLKPDSSPDNIDAWDSAKHIDLIMTLEEEFDIQFDEDSILEMLSLKTIIDAVEKKLSKNE